MRGCGTARVCCLFAIGAPLVVTAIVQGEGRKEAPLRGQAVSEAFPVSNAEGLAPEEFVAQQRDLSAWLKAETPRQVIDRPVRVEITEEESAELLAAPLSGESPMKVGFAKPLDQAIQITGLGRTEKGMRDATPLARGMLSPTADGGYVWAASFHSPGASGLRVHVEGMDLPAGAELYLHSPTGEAYGPYTGRGLNGDGDMWTASVQDSTGVLQLRVQGPADAAALRGLTFRVTELGHIGATFYGGSDDGAASFCSYNASCIENTNCVNESVVNDAENAVAKMLWVAGCCIYTCSGGLIADSDPAQGNYFLTANHCLSRNRDAQNLEAFFRYQVSCGTSTCTATYTDPPNSLIAGKTLGGSVRATGSAGDFTLLQLSQNPPAGSVFLGWTNSPVAFTNGAVLHRVSHPSGAPQAYSRQSVDTGATTCQGWPRGDRIYSRGTLGATEGGSSGSPVVNASGQIVGQLTGACGFNLNDECDHASNATVDGAFAHYWTSVQPYLEPGGGCVPSTEVCNDGQDNDCDGATDCADSNCTGDPSCSGCAPLGSPCTLNSDCCSNNCKGKTGSKTCK